ncbi:MAG: POTRA domain-containing protein, partial [Bdellovibrionales bacterium]
MIRHLAVFSFLLCGFSAWTESVQLLGAADQDVRRVKRDVPAAFDGELTMDEVDEVVRVLAQTGAYERVLAQQLDNGQIQVVAKPLRTIRQVVIKGQKNFGEADLRAVINIRPGDRFERKKVLEAGERLKQYYGERGFFNCVIEVNFSKETESTLTVSFMIDEKPPSRITKIEIESVNPNLNDRLSRFTIPLRKKPLTMDSVASLRKKIETFLKEHRFLRS